jgi:hypothetical protein
MANSKSNSANTTQDLDTEVLYQKLGDQWFAFSVMNDEVFMSPVPEEKILEIKQENPSAEVRFYDL